MGNSRKTTAYVDRWPAARLEKYRLQLESSSMEVTQKPRLVRVGTLRYKIRTSVHEQRFLRPQLKAYIRHARRQSKEVQLFRNCWYVFIGGEIWQSLNGLKLAQAHRDALMFHYARYLLTQR